MFIRSTALCEHFDSSESRLEIHGKIRNMVLEKDGEVQLDRSCDK
jgi:hypothetical protein